MKIGFFGDLHAGHILGITHPRHIPQSHPLFDFMTHYYNWFYEEIRKAGPFDVAVWGGDLTEGEGKKDNRFHLTTDVNRQIDLASEIVDLVGAPRNIFVYGTPYHCSGALDYEKEIADRFGGDIQTEQRINISGVRYALKHCGGGKSGTPVGGDLAVKKRSIWNMLKPDSLGNFADFTISWHVHEYRRDENSQTTGITGPALKHGSADYDPYARKLEGFYDVGFFYHEIDDDGFVWHRPVIRKLPETDREYKIIL